jgi:hypothetical protein
VQRVVHGFHEEQPGHQPSQPSRRLGGGST